MPDIDLIPVPFFQGEEPYHYIYDNLPLQAIVTRQELINDAVDINSAILDSSCGTQGTLANRLAQSTNDDGTLITSAIDSALHNIAAHDDGSLTLSGDELDTLENLGYTLTNPVPFVRMLTAERDKLSLVSSEATALKLEAPNSPSTVVVFDNQTVTLANSDSFAWTVIAPSTLQANLAVSLDNLHESNYGLAPVSANLISPDYINYKVTSISTPYIEGSLRVYINGIRLNETVGVYVPPASGPNGTWNLTSYAEDSSAGTFIMNRAVSSSDVIRIDFDVAVG